MLPMWFPDLKFFLPKAIVYTPAGMILLKSKSDYVTLWAACGIKLKVYVLSSSSLSRRISYYPKSLCSRITQFLEVPQIYNVLLETMTLTILLSFPGKCFPNFLSITNTHILTFHSGLI